MPKRGLTPKQQRFCEEYLVDFNCSQAALRAGYAKKSAHVTGHNLLKNHKVVALIAAGAQRLFNKADIKAENVLEGFRRIAFADMRNLAEWEDGVLKLKDSSELSEEDAFAIQEVSQMQWGVKVKLASRQAALDSLGKYLQLFIERHHHVIEDNTGVLAISAEQSAEDWESEYGVAVQSPEPETEHKNGAVN